MPCEVCKGQRYNRETLLVKYKGKSINDVLEMTVDEACEFFRNLSSIYNKIKTLKDVGLGYIKLGQSSTTLSGGEAQRVKLATELSKRRRGGRSTSWTSRRQGCTVTTSRSSRISYSACARAAIR